MTFKAPPAILQRVLRFKALKHEQGGRLSLWGIPATINPNYSTVYLQRLFEKKHGIKESASMFYALGVTQGRAAFRMISERFGYAETFHDKKKLLEFETGQSMVVGHGSFDWKKMDFDNNIFIAKGNSLHAEEYKRFFGIQKNHVDHFLRGVTSAFIAEVTGKNIFCGENRCIASGDTYCELVAKPIDSWDKNDRMFKAQLVDNIVSMRELGAKMDPYIIIK